MAQHIKCKKKGNEIIITEFILAPEPRTIYKTIASVKDERGNFLFVDLKEVPNPKWKP